MWGPCLPNEVVDEVSAVYCTNSTGQFCDYGDETMQGTAAGFSTDTWYLTAKALAAAGITVYNGQHQFVDDASVLLDASLLDVRVARADNRFTAWVQLYFARCFCDLPRLSDGVYGHGFDLYPRISNGNDVLILYGRPTPLLPSAWPAFTTASHNVHLLNTDLLGNLFSNNVQDTDSQHLVLSVVNGFATSSIYYRRGLSASPQPPWPPMMRWMGQREGGGKRGKGRKERKGREGRVKGYVGSLV